MYLLFYRWPEGGGNEDSTRKNSLLSVMMSDEDLVVSTVMSCIPTYGFSFKYPFM